MSAVFPRPIGRTAWERISFTIPAAILVLLPSYVPWNARQLVRTLMISARRYGDNDMDILGYFRKYNSLQHYAQENWDGWPLHSLIAGAFMVGAMFSPMETMLIANTIWWPDREARQKAAARNASAYPTAASSGDSAPPARRRPVRCIDWPGIA